MGIITISSLSEVTMVSALDDTPFYYDELVHFFLIQNGLDWTDMVDRSGQV